MYIEIFDWKVPVKEILQLGFLKYVYFKQIILFVNSVILKELHNISLKTVSEIPISAS